MKIKISDDTNKYFTSFFDPELGLYEVYWTKETRFLNETDYKHLVLKEHTTATVKGYDVKIQLLDNRHFKFVMSPELQDWQEEKITPNLTSNGKYPKTAIVQSSDFISQVFIEQTMQDTTGQVKYFDDIQEARSWLLKGDV